MNKEIQKVNLLLDTIDSGLMNEETIGCFTYDYLVALLHITRQLENGQELYWNIKTYLESINIQRLHVQLEANEKVIVGFIANYASTWIGDDLYRLLERSEEFEPYVFLMPNHASGQRREEIMQEYSNHLSYFRTRNIHVLQTLDLDSGIQYTWEQIGIKPQLCIWLTPWFPLFGEGRFSLLAYPLNTIHTYIPYCFMIPDNEEGSFSYDQYDQLLHNITWKNFETCRIDIEIAKKYSFIKGRNAVYTGYPKMDAFYEESIDEEDLWDVLIKKTNNPKAKRIIYAPHHTVGKSEPIHFSTFAFNYMFMLEMAKKYQEKTVWVFKPHPQLKYKAIQEGIFSDIEGWRIYEQRWRDLKNAEVAEEGMYHRLFKGSDAMISDSVSFLAEYLYVHKPLLRLTRKGQYFNDFGKRLIKIHYSAEGTDKKKIENFLISVVLAENDEKREERERFFEENLDYRKEERKDAAVNILDQLYEIKRVETKRISFQRFVL